jgi:hypothetical protein
MLIFSFIRTASDHRGVPVKMSDQPSSSHRQDHSPVIMDSSKTSPAPSSSTNIKRHASFHGILPSKKEDLVRSGSTVSLYERFCDHSNVSHHTSVLHLSVTVFYNKCIILLEWPPFLFYYKFFCAKLTSILLWLMLPRDHFVSRFFSIIVHIYVSFIKIGIPLPSIF